MHLASPFPAPHPNTTGPQSLKSYPFHRSEGGQLDSVTSQVAVGRGCAVCSSHSSARCEIHISWRCPRGLFPSVLVLAGEKASELERPVWGWGTGRTHCKSMLSPGNSCPGGSPTSQQLSNHPFCSQAANDAIKFIRRTSVDRTIGYSLKEAHGTQATEQPGVKGLEIIPVDFISHLQTKPQVSSEPRPASEDIGGFMPLSGSLRALTPQPPQEFLSALGFWAGGTLLSKHDMTWSAAMLRPVVLAVSSLYTKAHIQMFVLGQPQGSGVE